MKFEFAEGKTYRTNDGRTTTLKPPQEGSIYWSSETLGLYFDPETGQAPPIDVYIIEEVQPDVDAIRAEREAMMKKLKELTG